MTRTRTFALVLLVSAIQFPVRAGADEEPVTKSVFDGKGADVDPGAGTWRTFVLEGPSLLHLVPRPKDAAQLDAELAEVEAWAADDAPETLTAIDQWKAGTAVTWNALERRLVAEYSVSPPEASRIFALTSVTMYDAMVASWAIKYAYLRATPAARSSRVRVRGSASVSPSYVSERAALSSAAAAVLTALFPDARYPKASSTIEALLGSAVKSERHSGAHFRSDITAGVELGRRVAELVIGRARADGADRAAEGYVPSQVRGRWEPTPSRDGSLNSSPLLPGWGRVRTWVLASGDAIRPSAPARIGSEEWTAQIEAVHRTSHRLSPQERQIADKWVGGAGTATPAGMWNALACDLGVADGMSEPRLVRMLALLGVAQADAFVACWDSKYAYDCCRPITAIRETIDAKWQSYLETPPFPSYPSGHATTSSAAAQVLSFQMPGHGVELMAMADQATDSRLLGGIHTPQDNDVGRQMGRLIANGVIQWVTSERRAEPMKASVAILPDRHAR